MRTCGGPLLVIQRPWFARLIEALIRAGVVEVGTARDSASRDPDRDWALPRCLGDNRITLV